MMAIAIVRNLELEQAIGEAFTARNEAVAPAGHIVARYHFLPTDASAKKRG
jgi:hypothetical protein